MKLKGISPLIAAVLLIAFTMAIAGILAIWATTFSQQRLQTAGECPALTVQDISYTTGSSSAVGKVNLRLLNTNKNTAQTGIKVSALYPDGINQEGVTFGTGTLNALGVSSNVISLTARAPVSNTTPPTRVEIVTSECPTTPIVAIVP